jgi:hypothetical protein
VRSSGQILCEGRYYWVSGALAGEQIGFIEAEGRLLIYFRRTLVRAVDLDQAAGSKKSA